MLKIRTEWSKRIRREHIQKFYKTKRNELLLARHLQFQTNLPDLLSYPSIEMLQTHGNDYLQLLRDCLLSPHPHTPKQLSPILHMLLQYYSHLYSHHYEEDIPIATLVAVYSSFDPHLYFSIINLLYFQCVESQEGEDVVQIVLAGLDYCFQDRCILSQHSENPPRLDRNTLLNILWNMSYSDQQQQIDMLIRSNVFDDIENYLTIYGFTEQELESVAGLYCNSIESIIQFADRSRDMNGERNSGNGSSVESYFVGIFEGLVGLTGKEPIERVVEAAILLLKKPQARAVMSDSLITLLANIFTSGLVVPIIDLLFIQVAPNIVDLRLPSTLFLELLEKSVHGLSSSLIEAHHTHNHKSRLGRVIQVCEQLLHSHNQHTPSSLQIPAMLFERVLNFFLEDELTECEGEFMRFMFAGITCGLLGIYNNSKSLKAGYSAAIMSIFENVSLYCESAEAYLDMLGAYLREEPLWQCSENRQILVRLSARVETLVYMCGGEIGDKAARMLDSGMLSISR